MAFLLPGRSVVRAGASPLFLGLVLLALVAGLVALGGPVARADGTSAAAAPAPAPGYERATDVRRTRGLFVDPLMHAAQAGEEFRRIGERAQPLWVTDYYKLTKVKAAVRRYAARAVKAGKTPLLSVYNIPDRDCGLYSSQDEQITDRYYRSWVTKVAGGLRGTKPMVILEPDAIAFIGNPQCTGRGDRLGLLKFAVRQLTRAGAWVYIDAGHSGWQTPKHMAPLLKRAGVGLARGFATNVANTRATADELSFARAILRQLKRLKVRGPKFVIDTGRNGAGRNGPPNGDVCNPLAARLGKPPRLVFNGAYDGNLWVKNPGESDGPCNGGPDSGVWWPDGARRLMGTL